MLGAFCAWFLLERWGIGYWWSLLIAPIVIAAFGIVIERDAVAPVQARPPVRPAADVRARADDPGRVHQRSTAAPASRTPAEFTGV
jgi:hypothetical protein